MKPTLTSIERRVATLETSHKMNNDKDIEERGLIIFCPDENGVDREIFRSSDYRPAKRNGVVLNPPTCPPFEMPDWNKPENMRTQ